MAIRNVPSSLTQSNAASIQSPSQQQILQNAERTIDAVACGNKTVFVIGMLAGGYCTR